jgi:hypothetical protein
MKNLTNFNNFGKHSFLRESAEQNLKITPDAEKKLTELEQMAEYARNAEEDADPKIVAAIRECIGLGVGPGQSNYSHLSTVIVSGGGYIVGMLAMLMAAPAAAFVGSCLAFASMVVIFLEGISHTGDGKGLTKGSVVQEVTRLRDCLRAKKVID